jgi:hypothetical protein
LSNIIIHKPVYNRKKLTSEITTPPELTKYIKNSTLFIEYDTQINTNPSILNIPLTAAILPLAWLTGSNIQVGSLDKTFKNSMENLRNLFKDMYPKASFNTEIQADKLVDNKINPKDPQNTTGILFSGGVDSIYTMVQNIELNPQLVMLWGIDNFAYPEHSDHWEKTISIYKKFAERKKLKLYIAKTNISQILDNRRIEHRYHKELYNGRFRSALQHSLVLLPTAAPLSIGRFNHFQIAASGQPRFDYTLRPRAAISKADEKIIWADLKVEHHGFIGRVPKVIAIRDYLEKENLILRVCLRSKLKNGMINEGTCEKCLRTIASLALMGLDPNNHGFHVDESTFKAMRDMWENRKTALYGTTWRNMKDLASKQMPPDIHGSQAFFDWFKDFDFESIEKNWFYTDLYNQLPYWIARYLDKLYARAY